MNLTNLQKMNFGSFLSFFVLILSLLATFCALRSGNKVVLNSLCAVRACVGNLVVSSISFILYLYIEISLSYVFYSKFHVIGQKVKYVISK
mmetsp:Transcript_41250/g.41877  ORF Transcript_41250/g.41877 Transcript_41250/m.41877 type:complete len:91 (-) Transcript_41250:5-277(-)